MKLMVAVQEAATPGQRQAPSIYPSGPATPRFSLSLLSSISFAPPLILQLQMITAFKVSRIKGFKAHKLSSK